MFIKPLVIALSLGMAVAVHAQPTSLSLAETDKAQIKHDRLLGTWTYNSCASKSRSARDHVLEDGELFELQISASSNERIAVSHSRWTMIEEPVIRLVDGDLVAADGIAVIDGHQHRLTFIPADASSCPGMPKEGRVIRIEFTDVEHSHGDSQKHMGHTHGSDHSGG